MIKRLLIVFFLVIFGAFLFSTVIKLPPAGDPNNPTNTRTVPRYLDRGPEETGCSNVVTAVLLGYRNYDAMGEMVVLFTTLVAALAILGREGEEKPKKKDYSTVSPLIQAVLVVFTPFFLMFAFYVVVGGLAASGGGFQGGVITAAALIIYTLIFGFAVGIKRIPSRIRVCLESLAIFCFTVVGFLGMIGQGSFLAINIPSLGAWSESIRTLVLLTLELSIGLASGTIIVSLFFILRKRESE